MKQQLDDTFLARWAAGELTDQELADFKSSDVYDEYKMIMDGVTLLETPSYNLEQNLQATLAKIDQQKNKEVKVRKLVPNWAYAAAASVVLFLGYIFFFQETTYTTQLAEISSVELPDGSIVELNADSRIKHKSFNWNRNLNLEGEAFFKVKKGSTFTVNTKEGEVTVLGTQFTVKSRPNFYEVICYEGKVQVISQNEKHLLTVGKAVRFIKNKSQKYNLQSPTPSWINNESNFVKVPIIEVINELERQYNITIKGKENIKSAYFTGRFVHSNLDQALLTVFDTMEIPYTFDAGQQVSIQKY